MEDRVLGDTGSDASAGRLRRLRAMFRGYPIRRWQVWLSMAMVGLFWASPALAESGSRYAAPLWSWIAAVLISAALSLAGLVIGVWFLRKRSRISGSD